MVINNEINMIEKHFEVYKNLIKKIYVKKMKLIKAKEDFYSVSGVRYDDVKIKGGTPYDIADQLQYITDKENELRAIINYKEDLKRVHEKEIDRLSNNNERITLKLFYLDECSIKQIAHCLRVSEGHIKKLKRWGVHEFVGKIIKKGGE